MLSIDVVQILLLALPIFPRSHLAHVAANLFLMTLEEERLKLDLLAFILCLFIFFLLTLFDPSESLLLLEHDCGSPSA
jgi:hypothetical protein